MRQAALHTQREAMSPLLLPHTKHQHLSAKGCHAGRTTPALHCCSNPRKTSKAELQHSKQASHAGRTKLAVAQLLVQAKACRQPAQLMRNNSAI